MEVCRRIVYIAFQRSSYLSTSYRFHRGQDSSRGGTNQIYVGTRAYRGSAHVSRRSTRLHHPETHSVRPKRSSTRCLF